MRYLAKVNPGAPTYCCQISPAPASGWLKPTAATAVALLMAAVYLLHVHGFSGKPPSLDYHWHSLPPLRVYPALPLAAAHWLRRHKPRCAIVLLALALPVWQLAGSVVTTNPYGLNEMVLAIQSPKATSYYTDAIRLVDAHQSIAQILAKFPRLMPNFHVHGREKPPGQAAKLGLTPENLRPPAPSRACRNG